MHKLLRELRSKQQIQKTYYVIGSEVQKPLHNGEVARMQRQGKWIQLVTVIEQHDAAPKSYLVQTQDDWVYKRNRQHILQTIESQCFLLNDNLIKRYLLERTRTTYRRTLTI